MKVRLFPFVILIVAVWLFPRHTLAQTSAPDVATVEVSQVDNSAYPEVTVYVRILDTSGNRVPNLTQQQFAVTEDGSPVEIIAFSPVNEQAITTLLVIDISGSMAYENKLFGAIEAALTFMDLMRPQDQTGLIVFNESVSSLLSPTKDQSALREAITPLLPQGNTAWYDAVATAVEEISLISGRKSIILLSDGLDNSSRTTFEAAIGMAGGTEAPVYTIGLGQKRSGWMEALFGESYDEKRLSQMAAATGGEFYATPTAAELEALYRKLSQSTQEEYVLTYRSPRPDYDGTRRDIQVTVSGKGGSGGYVEQHLVTIESDLIVGLWFLFPLLLAVIAPLASRSLLHYWRARRISSRRVKPISPQPPSVSPAIPPAQPANRNIAPSSQSSSPDTSLCPHCGGVLRTGVKFCAKCGKAVVIQAVRAQPETSVKNWCPHCHQPVRQGARFCGGCGRQL